jgi:hypothetical protein
VVPRTTTYAKVQERQRRKAEAEAAKAASANADASHQGDQEPLPSQDGPAYPGATTNGHQGFAGPSAGHYGSRSREVNILDDTEPMDVDQQGNSYQPMPSTASMLEKARAANQRAEFGPSPPSSASILEKARIPSQRPEFATSPSSSAHPYYPPPAGGNANANAP